MLGEKLTALRKRCGYSQQELAEKLSVTRQTISNWECGQGAPALDKAAELAKIYQISLDDLVGEQVEVVVKERPQQRVLSRLVGKYVKMECSDTDLLVEHQGKVKVVDVTENWIRVEYSRAREGSLFKKENVIKLIDIDAVEGFEVEEEDE